MIRTVSFALSEWDISKCVRPRSNSSARAKLIVVLVIWASRKVPALDSNYWSSESWKGQEQVVVYRKLGGVYTFEQDDASVRHTETRLI